MAAQNKALVLGATGGIGGEVATRLLDAGWQVRALRRGRGPVAPASRIDWMTGDAMNRSEVLAAAAGCDVIVHAVNPPGYKHWSEVVLPMLDNTIAAAIRQAATIVLPGTIYNFGPDAFPVLTEDSPQHPTSRKGAIRVELEQRLRQASDHGARVIIVRAGDFFGPKAGNNWFSQGLVQPGRAVDKVTYPGGAGIGHQWGYLPDVACTMVALLEHRPALDPFASFHMAGHWDSDGTEMKAAICRVVHQYTGRLPRTVAFPWWLLTLASPVVETLREMREMRYLWQTPIRMSNSKLVATLGYEPHTPLDDAVRASLLGMGALKP